jgi:hypothetical protein
VSFGIDSTQHPLDWIQGGKMTEETQPIYFPPFEDVRLIERRDFIVLVPVCAYREIVGNGQ